MPSIAIKSRVYRYKNNNLISSSCSRPSQISKLKHGQQRYASSTATYDGALYVEAGRRKPTRFWNEALSLDQARMLR